MRFEGIEAVIFDMDGVIVDSEPRHERAYMEVVRELGYGETHGLRFQDYLGRSDKELWMDFVALHRPPYALDHLLKLKRDKVIGIIRSERPLFDGLAALVRRVARKFKVGLASGSERAVIEEVLRIDNLGQYFQAVVSSTDVRAGKPAPDIFLRTAELLGVRADRCCVIEDSKPGIAAGKAAGMRVIAIPNTHPALELTHADFVARTYDDIGKCLFSYGPEP